MIAFYLALYLVMVVFGLTSLAVGSALGAQVSAVNIGWPRLFSVGTVRVGLLPLTSSTEVRGRTGDEGNWFQLSLARRLAITVAPFGAYALVAVLCLGPMRAADSIAHGFTQVFVTPDTTPLMRAFVAWLRDAGFAVVIGVVFAKCFVMNTVTTAGGLFYELRLRKSGLWNLLIMSFSIVWITGRMLWGLYHALFT